MKQPILIEDFTVDEILVGNATVQLQAAFNIPNSEIGWLSSSGAVLNSTVPPQVLDPPITTSVSTESTQKLGKGKFVAKKPKLDL